MHRHHSTFTASRRSRHASRGRSGPVETAISYPLDENVPVCATYDWLGAVVLALSLLAGAGLVMLIQLNPVLLRALESAP